MPKSMIQYDVFIASPSDVADERNAVDDILDELNQTTCRQHNIMLNSVRWENDAYPGFGEDGQDVINNQINNYDIFIGIMGGKFGKPTKRDSSGTKEEFEIAYSKYLNKEILHIMFYFKNSSIIMSDIEKNIGQITEVLKFKAEIEEKGALYFSFQDIEQFKKHLRIHLNRVITEVLLKETNQSINLPTEIITEQYRNELDIVEAETAELPGLYEDMIATQECFTEVSESLLRMTANVVDVGQDFRLASSEVVKNQSKPHQLQAGENIRIINELAEKMLLYAERTDNEMAIYKSNFEKGINSISNIYSIMKDAKMENGDWNTTVDTLLNIRNNMPETIGEMAGFRQVAKDLPPLTRPMNKAKQRLIKVLDRLINEFEFSVQLINEFDNQR